MYFRDFKRVITFVNQYSSKHRSIPSVIQCYSIALVSVYDILIGQLSGQYKGQYICMAYICVQLEFSNRKSKVNTVV